jgi:hypothetical protein
VTRLRKTVKAIEVLVTMVFGWVAEIVCGDTESRVRTAVRAWVVTEPDRSWKTIGAVPLGWGRLWDSSAWMSKHLAVAEDRGGVLGGHVPERPGGSARRRALSLGLLRGETCFRGVTITRPERQPFQGWWDRGGYLNGGYTPRVCSLRIMRIWEK